MQFWQIYDEYYQPVRAFLAAMLRDPWTADDLVQDTFLKVKKNLSTLKDPDKIKPWIFRIARNLCLDHLRQKTAQPLGSEPGPEAGCQPQPPPILQRLEQEEMSRCVQEKMQLLPETQRSMLILFDLMELTHQEIADVLGIEVNAAKVRLHRARKALKEILQKECTFEFDERNVMVCLPKPEPL
jgi:RNA polymerase sigma-70 factor (ECF subfamily)